MALPKTGEDYMNLLSVRSKGGTHGVVNRRIHKAVRWFRMSSHVDCCEAIKSKWLPDFTTALGIFKTHSKIQSSIYSDHSTISW